MLKIYGRKKNLSKIIFLSKLRAIFSFIVKIIVISKRLKKIFNFKAFLRVPTKNFYVPHAQNMRKEKKIS